MATLKKRTEKAIICDIETEDDTMHVGVVIPFSLLAEDSQEIVDGAMEEQTEEIYVRTWWMKREGYAE